MVKKEAKMASSESAAGFGIGLLVGAALGVAIGMLYAPQSGKETRALIAEKTGEAKDVVSERAKKVVDDIRGK